ncbi:MAG TPA: 4-aminobutyrate--2-oxoglutarate transaminase [Candidatus Eremiobacteraceae bacterium]|nr:4-aminobutyrate--2-oxoglutarate transaminase [Candidatus Eremiobacteraceae bacterium]
MAVTISRTSELLELRSAEVPRGVGNTHPVFAERAQGAKIWDIEGKEYIDFVGGIGVNNVGHAHPKIQAAISEQLQRFIHTCFQVVMYESYVKLAQRLNALAPGPSKKKTVLFTTGAEAAENAIKIARSHTGRPAVLAFHHGFHGRTLLALTMTGKNDPYKQRFGPFCSEIYHAPYPYEYHGWTTKRALQALDEVFESEVSPSRLAAIIIEPVLGEGGFVPAPVEYLKELRKIADQHGIVLIADEIQTGYGRTGKMFAIEHAGIEPDIITLAKSMAGGMPLSAVVGRADVMDSPTAGGLGGTFGGNPLACAAALATLDVIEEEHLLERARTIGAKVEQALRDLKRRHRKIGDVRGLGAMIGMEFVSEGGVTGTAVAARVLEEARNRGLLLLAAGAKRDIIRVLVPLVISDEDLDSALHRLAEACDAALSAKP